MRDTRPNAATIPLRRDAPVSMTFAVTLERDEDGVFVAVCPSIPGCVSQGDTEEEAMQNIEEAIRACLEVRSELGLPLTVTTRTVKIAV